jgi:hypothetical protein
MSIRERIRDRYPIFYAYGDEHEFLDAEAAAAATPESRIQSIWPFIVKRVLSFQSTLKAIERANCDAEDTLTELWIALREKDRLWSPDRGKYITFAGVVIDRELCAIRDRARTVHSPRNSSCRLKEYRAEEADGTISARRRKTFDDIRRTSEGIQPIVEPATTSARTLGEDHDADALTSQEERHESIDALKAAIKRLTAFEARVVGKMAGLWGQAPQSVWRIAWEAQRDPSEVRRAYSRAWRKIKVHLIEIDHPVASRCS